MTAARGFAIVAGAVGLLAVGFAAAAGVARTQPPCWSHGQNASACPNQPTTASASTAATTTTAASSTIVSTTTVVSTTTTKATATSGGFTANEWLSPSGSDSGSAC